MKIKLNRRGFFFTLGIVLIIIPLILLILFYTTTSRTKTDDVIGKIRCDELHYFVEDVNEDIKRAMVIFGRRAAIYSLDEVITTGVPLKNYEFNCTVACGIDCNKFVFGENGTEAAIAELALCGTLSGENVSYMLNHTLSEWMDRVKFAGNYMNFEFNISIANLTVVPYDAWNFAIILNYRLDVADKSQMCYYAGDSMEIISITSILGLEDVLFPLNTNAQVIKYINSCTTEIEIESVAGCSLSYGGNGTAAGKVIFYSDIEDETTKDERESYCSVFEDVVDDQILVADKTFGSFCKNFDQCCFNETCEHHFSGIINYGPSNPSAVGGCALTIPWITHTCKMDEETGFGPGVGCKRPEGCNETLIQTDTCVLIKEGCDVYLVLVGFPCNELNTTCYMISNVTEASYDCPIEFSDGPSFFDRLDGSYNLSEKYVNQSLMYFNNPRIGIETLISPFELDDYGIEVKKNMTWTDYLYWQNVEACEVAGTCASGPHTLRLDCPHAQKFYVDTDCINVTECISLITTTTSTSTTSTSILGTTTTSTTTTIIPCTGFFDDMESGEGGWTPEGEWELGSPDWGNCHDNSDNCRATDREGKGIGGDYYENDIDESLISPSISLWDVTSASLTFWTKYKIRDDDYGYVEISAGGGDWEELKSFTDDRISWTQETIDLSDYVGNSIRIRFRLKSNEEDRDRGLYIDDVSVTCS